MGATLMPTVNVFDWQDTVQVTTPPPSGGLPNAPAWVLAIDPGEWATVSLNTLAAVDPEDDAGVNPNYPGNAPWRGNSGQGAVIGAWNGGAAIQPGDLGASDLGGLLLHGGGHAAYYGSEVYRFNLNTRLFERLTNPYPGPFNWPYPTARYPDGSPCPPHTYYYPVWHRAAKVFAQTRGCKDSVVTGNDSDVGYSAMLPIAAGGAGSWRYTPFNALIDGQLNSGGAACYDSQRECIWVQPVNAGSSRRLGQLTNVATQNGDGSYGTWTNHAISNSGSTDTAMEYDEDNDLLVCTSFRTGTSIFWRRPSAPSAAAVTVAQSGNIPTREPAAGWAWSRRRRAFLYYRRGAGVHEFKITNATDGGAAGAWSGLTASGNAVTPENMATDNGIYGRFQTFTFADAEVALVVNGSAQAVYAFRVP